MHPSMLQLSGRRYVTDKALSSYHHNELRIYTHTFKHVTNHTTEMLTWYQIIPLSNVSTHTNNQIVLIQTLNGKLNLIIL